MDAQNSIDALDQLLRSDESISPAEAKTLQRYLEDPPIQDIVRLVERYQGSRAAVALRLLPRRRAIEVFDALDPAHQADLIGALQNREVFEFFDELDPDDRVSLLDELPAEIAERLMRNLEPSERDITGVVLGYPKGSVGRRMSPEVPSLFVDLTVDEALTVLKKSADDVETIYSLPVISRDRRLEGICSLREIFTAPSGTRLEEIVTKPVVANAHDDAEETARWFLPLDFLALPVVDDSNRLVGLLTADDAHDIVEEEDTEDSARIGGSEPLQQPYLSTPLMRIVRSRVVWLLVLAVSALLTVKVLDTFEETLEQAIVLSLFIPLLTGTGGNTGNQAATTVTRALALGDVRTGDVLSVMWREVRVGFTLGALLGILGFVLASVIYSLPLGIVMGTTLLAICTMSATVGGIMPLIAKTCGADPAVFSNPFISTFCDATGLIIYFFIARTVLGI
ncbi:magnesium transporter [Corynebacterium otitidis]|uniref:Magnesium transporter MgtE n=1 Tax=Corynebacterium otitidis ATCC 51513 TaxID=883169 RepID=I7JWR8_9CORY|nr:magnesium transporter [Corynebacterium otitidis]EJZ81406.1 magnesium transporter [Corynebacterium otitidis ATCC 51513]CCI84051.1 magnesium transporter [Corynebacterium otitidis ATCC 51513]